MYRLAENTQKRIESLYGVKLITRVRNSITNKTKHVEDFIGEDKKTKYITYKNKEYGSTHGKILKNRLETLVYIHPRVIKNLKENNPFKSLNERNLLDFLALIKGVDYWEYLNAKFELEKTPSKFELELQTTITKYWIVTGFMSNHNDKSATRFMLNYKDNLNENYLNFLMINVFPQGYLKLDKNVDVDKLIKGEEYPIAYTLAGIYCNHLTGKGIDLVLFSLRKFRMLDAEEKVKYILEGRI